jgi:hypothetical protein
MTWLLQVFGKGFSFGFTGDSLITSMVILLSVAFYAAPLALFMFADRVLPEKRNVEAVLYGLALVAITVFSRSGAQDFIYFQF